MPAPVDKRLKVTFRKQLPGGTWASFEYEGQEWTAYPTKKIIRILTVIDLLLGLFGRMQNEMLRIIKNSPEDAIWVAGIFKYTQRARKLHRELIYEKAEGQTS